MNLLLKKNFIPILLITILIFSRLIPHPPNFTPVISSALLGIYFFKNFKISAIVVIISMMISDFILGLHLNMLSVYLSIFLIMIIYNYFQFNLNFKNLIIHGFLSSFIFFIITNLGVWVFTDLYTKNISGIIECYYYAIPFFKNTFLSTIFFCYIFLFFFRTSQSSLKYN